MRVTRLNKFKKRYRSFLIAFQLLTIWYFIIISTLQLNSFTNASFNDVEELDSSLHVSWYIDDWDKSSLSFDGMQSGGKCGRVYAGISRGKNPIQFSTWKYDVFKVSESKTPIGNPIDTGFVSKEDINESDRVATMVSNKITENGKYQFRVRRPLGHPGNNQPDPEGYTYMWSEAVIEVKDCTQPLLAPEEKTPENQEIPKQEPKENTEVEDSSDGQGEVEEKQPTNPEPEKDTSSEESPAPEETQPLVETPVKKNKEEEATPVAPEPPAETTTEEVTAEPTALPVKE